MATSGSVDFTMTAGEIVDKAFSKLGVKVAEQALEASEIQDGLDGLNMMFKTWQAQGLHLWSKTEGILFLDKGKSDYLIGPTGDEAATFDDFIGTTTTTAIIATDTIIPVASSAGMVALDTIGIELDDGSRHWTTILSVDSTVQVTLTTGVVSGAAAGNTVYTYTSQIQRPLRVLDARRATYGIDSDISVNRFSRSEYFNQNNKLNQGTVVNYYYSPQLGNGRFYVWQTASSVKGLVKFTFERAIEDIDDKDNNVDFPAEWLETIVYNLASRLADDYDAPALRVQTIAAKAGILLDQIEGWDEEPSSINIQPEFN